MVNEKIEKARGELIQAVSDYAEHHDKPDAMTYAHKVNRKIDKLLTVVEIETEQATE
jgi:hypothetical protein